MLLFNCSPIPAVFREPYQSNHKPKQSSSHSSPLSIGRQQQALISYPLCIHTIFLQPSSAPGIQQLRPTFISVNPACVPAPALTIQTHSHISAARLEGDDKGHHFILYLPLHLLLIAEARQETASWGAQGCG